MSGTVSCKPVESVTSKQLQQQIQGAANAGSTPSTPVPTTTNASTMTSAVVVTNVAPAPARALVATMTSTGTTTTTVASLTTSTAASSQADVCSATVSYTSLLFNLICMHHNYMRCLLITLLILVLLHLIEQLEVLVCHAVESQFLF
jgi:hypothetical protein